MRKYETPVLELLILYSDTALAAVIQSEPTVEDNDEDLSV